MDLVTSSIVWNSISQYHSKTEHCEHRTQHILKVKALMELFGLNYCCITEAEGRACDLDACLFASCTLVLVHCPLLQLTAIGHQILTAQLMSSAFSLSPFLIFWPRGISFGRMCFACDGIANLFQQRRASFGKGRQQRRQWQQRRGGNGKAQLCDGYRLWPHPGLDAQGLSQCAIGRHA